MRISDWSSDVCSSDLQDQREARRPEEKAAHHRAVAVQARSAPASLTVCIMTTASGKVSRQPQGVTMVSPGPAGQTLPGERSEEHTSELQSLMRISYAVFCLKKKNTPNDTKLHLI